MRLPDLFRRRKRSPLILMYHRVDTVAHDPWGLAVAPERFLEQMAVLAADCCPLPMTSFVEHHRAGTLRSDHVAITFDDGYLDNLTHARPALERYKIPATVFVVTDYLPEGRAFWWDEWARLTLARAGSIDVNLRVGDTAIHLAWDSPPSPQDWRAWTPPTNRRERCFIEHYADLQAASPDMRETFFSDLRRVTADCRHPLERSMSHEELARHISGGGANRCRRPYGEPPSARTD